MIDFSCCEVQKAVKALYSDNEVLSINPILKPYGESFEVGLTKVYYGKFTNPDPGQIVSYRGQQIEFDDWILFNDIENPLFDFFQGYEINLKNGLPNL